MNGKRKAELKIRKTVEEGDGKWIRRSECSEK
jgi:hypothetical protein